jgi:hypothetical protein
VEADSRTREAVKKDYQGPLKPAPDWQKADEEN